MKWAWVALCLKKIQIYIACILYIWCTLRVSNCIAFQTKKKKVTYTQVIKDLWGWPLLSERPCDIKGRASLGQHGLLKAAAWMRKCAAVMLNVAAKQLLATATQPERDCDIVSVRPGGGSRVSSSPCRNSLGYSSVLLIGFHFTAAIKDQYAGRFNDPISLFFAKVSHLSPAVSPKKKQTKKGQLRYGRVKCFLLSSMQLFTIAWRNAEQRRLQQRERLHWK